MKAKLGETVTDVFRELNGPSVPGFTYPMGLAPNVRLDYIFAVNGELRNL
jgi:hypothetical protein